MNDAHFLRILSSTPVDHSRSWRASALCERSKHRCCLLIITLPLVAVVPDTDTMLFSFLLLFIWDAAFRIIVVMRLYADANSSNGMEFLPTPFWVHMIFHLLINVFKLAKTQIWLVICILLAM